MNKNIRTTKTTSGVSKKKSRTYITGFEFYFCGSFPNGGVIIENIWFYVCWIVLAILSAPRISKFSLSLRLSHKFFLSPFILHYQLTRGCLKYFFCKEKKEKGITYQIFFLPSG